LRLIGRELRAVATTTTINEALQPSSLVQAAPIQQTGATTTGYFLELRNGVAGAIQSDSLIARADLTILRLQIRLVQFCNLRRGQEELVFGYAFIVWTLSDLSLGCRYGVAFQQAAMPKDS
jgi:hypothetical protein